MFTILLFMLKSTLWGFSKLMQGLCIYLQHKGYQVLLSYLDDFLFLLGVDKVGATRQHDASLMEFEWAGSSMSVRASWTWLHISSAWASS